MNNKNKSWLVATGMASSLFIPSLAHAAGFMLFEHSASSMGNAFAGAGATAADASTIFFNPAGMTYIKEREHVVAFHLIQVDAAYTDKGSTAATGGSLNGDNDDGGKDALVPNLYFLSPINDQWTWGIGFNAPFGLGTEYNDDWVGRYHAVKSDLKTVNINPSFGYRHNDQLSFGFGVSLQYLEVQLTSAVDFGGICVAQELGGVLPAGTCAAVGAQPQQNDGFADIEGDNWGYGFNFGVMYEAGPATRLGFAYRSEVEQAVTGGSADFTVPANVSFLTTDGLFTDQTAEATVDMPASATVSVMHRLNDKVTLLGDVTWTGWSSFKELRIKYPDTAQPDSVTTEDWEDNVRLAVGANYQYSDAMVLRVGAALDPTPIPNDERRTARIPGNDRTWLSLGLGYRFSPEVSVDVGYSHLFTDTTDINNTAESSVPTIQHSLVGSYESSVDIFSAQLRMKY